MAGDDAIQLVLPDEQLGEIRLHFEDEISEPTRLPDDDHAIALQFGNVFAFCSHQFLVASIGCFVFAREHECESGGFFAQERLDFIFAAYKQKVGICNA
ncbi:hypothetical protein [Raoultibacter phocaeensis]|uniref:hypothetical protein n=1 Tax=Raoultibacter phocaeensis TaxID=2479841 RepID=UPI0015D63FDF|nr:hypothetical protein [Raoultibacter phocaeensis]